MELRVLEYFLAIAQTETISRAAEVLHVTQPTLSRQMAQMERELGVKLFLRGRKKITLTAEGMLLRSRAEEILELVDKTETDLIQSEKSLAGTVAIGCGDLAAVQQLPALCRSFHEKYPQVRFDLHTGTADQIQERLDRGLADVGLLLEPVNVAKYAFIRLKQKEQWVAAMRPDSPLARLEAVSPADLKDVPLILPQRLNVQSELAHWFGDLYPKLNVLFTANLPSSSSVMVREGLACSLIIRGSIAFWDEKAVVCRPLRPALNASCLLAWRRLRPMSRAAEAFVAHAQSYFAEEEEKEP